MGRPKRLDAPVSTDNKGAALATDELLIDERNPPLPMIGRTNRCIDSELDSERTPTYAYSINLQPSSSHSGARSGSAPRHNSEK